MSNPRAGWYPDPTGKANTIRWWDGEKWTNQTETTTPSTDQPAPSTPAEPAAREAEPAAQQGQTSEQTDVMRTLPAWDQQPGATRPLPTTQAGQDAGTTPSWDTDQSAGTAPSWGTDQNAAMPSQGDDQDAGITPSWAEGEATGPTPSWEQGQATGPTPSWEKGQATGPAASWAQGVASAQQGTAQQSPGSTQQGWPQTSEPPVAHASGWSQASEQATASAWSQAGRTQAGPSPDGGQGWTGAAQGGQQGWGQLGLRRPEPQPSSSRRIPLPFMIAGAAVLVLLIAGGVFLVANRGDDPQAQTTPPPPTQATDSPSPNASESTQPTGSATPSDTITPGRSRNPALHAGNRAASDAISFPRQQPRVWSDRKRFSRAVINSSGQYAVLQQKIDGRNDWYSNIFVGTLNTSIPYNGHPKATASDLALELRNSFYQPIKIVARPVNSRPVSVGGHKGWLIRQAVGAKVKGLRSPNLYLTVAVFDLSDGTAVVYVSDVPANRPDLRANEAAAFRGLHIG